jgi:deoxyribodipyrimidine photo-lyase
VQSVVASGFLMSATIVWFRQDLRLQDNPALAAAVARGGPVVPVFIWDERGEGDWPPGAASRWWLHRSLEALDQGLRDQGLRLVVRRGDSGKALRDLIRETAATAVYWNRRYEPAVAARDTSLAKELGIETKSFHAALLFEPETVRNKAGGPFQVFTPFWRHCLTLPVAEPTKLRAGPLLAPARWPKSERLEDLGLKRVERADPSTLALKKRPEVRAFHLPATWQPGEAGAQARLKQFIRAMAAYADGRDQPADDATSRLSPHLHFGEISPRQVWAVVRAQGKGTGVFPPHRGAQVFLKELGWREFAHHLLHHFPTTPARPLRAEFAAFPWRKNARQLRAWQRGLTGYPIVDAGMRQLGQTGWMHNRVRMIVASFLVKPLRISWREGAAWFWDTLVDADLANNTLGWQWSAGCGADAAPYFRIFNPTLQGRKFDPDGTYVKRWVPELAHFPTEHLHAPWAAPAEARAAAGRPAAAYPAPIVDHGQARAAALAALKSLRRAGESR